MNLLFLLSESVIEELEPKPISLFAQDSPILSILYAHLDTEESLSESVSQEPQRPKIREELSLSFEISFLI